MFYGKSISFSFGSTYMLYIINFLLLCSQCSATQYVNNGSKSVFYYILIHKKREIFPIIMLIFDQKTFGLVHVQKVLSDYQTER